MQPAAAGPKARIRRRLMPVAALKCATPSFASRSISNRNWKELKSDATCLQSARSIFLIATRTGVNGQNHRTLLRDNRPNQLDNGCRTDSRVTHRKQSTGAPPARQFFARLSSTVAYAIFARIPHFAQKRRNGGAIRRQSRFGTRQTCPSGCLKRPTLRASLASKLLQNKTEDALRGRF